MLTWKRETLTYDICIPEMPDKRFYQFTKEEAKNHFEWYMSAIPERIEYMLSRCSQDMEVDRNALGFNENTLVIVWKWFRKIAKTEINDDGLCQLSLQSEYILRDIGMYFGEYFISEYKSIFWSYYSDPKDASVNRPVIMGFLDKSVTPQYKMYVDPIDRVRGEGVKLVPDLRDFSSCRILNDTPIISTDEDLLNAFIWYKQYIYEPGDNKLIDNECYNINVNREIPGNEIFVIYDIKNIKNRLGCWQFSCTKMGDQNDIGIDVIINKNIMSMGNNSNGFYIIDSAVRIEYINGLSNPNIKKILGNETKFAEKGIIKDISCAVLNGNPKNIKKERQELKCFISDTATNDGLEFYLDIDIPEKTISFRRII